MKFNDLPQNIQNWLDSENLSDALLGLTNHYNLGYKPAFIPGLVFKFVTGAMNGAMIYKAVLKEVADKNTADQLIKGIKNTALSPIKDLLLNIGVDINLSGVEKTEYKDDANLVADGGLIGELPELPPGLTVNPIHATAQTEHNNRAPEQTTLIKPTITEAPFILHNHNEEESKPRAEATPIDISPLRPMFYNAPFAPPQTEELAMRSRPITARLELGVETVEAQASAPKMSRTAREEVRQVNYSEFRTPLNDPFSASFMKPTGEKTTADQTTTTPPTENEPPKPPIPNANVVNLKDLPV
jgi:hypothetical protein